jgi:hypothetical protein
MRNSCPAPLIPFLTFDLPMVLKDIRARHFASMRISIFEHFARASLARSEPLASISVGESAAVVRLHEILNRLDTPREVVEHILVHELLHVLIRFYTGGLGCGLN